MPGRALVRLRTDAGRFRLSKAAMRPTQPYVATALVAVGPARVVGTGGRVDRNDGARARVHRIATHAILYFGERAAAHLA